MWMKQYTNSNTRASCINTHTFSSNECFYILLPNLPWPKNHGISSGHLLRDTEVKKMVSQGFLTFWRFCQKTCQYSLWGAAFSVQSTNIHAHHIQKVRKLKSKPKSTSHSTVSTTPLNKYSFVLFWFVIIKNLPQFQVSFYLEASLLSL
jgi:hypothetical protein